MDFSYDCYVSLINKLKKYYKIVLVSDAENTKGKVCVLRHDVDLSISKALEIAKLEHENGIVSTFYFLVHSKMYDIFDSKNVSLVKTIISYGHEIGLHYDESLYKDDLEIELNVKNEISKIENFYHIKIKSVSMHRPSQKTLTANYSFSNLINLYGSLFFKKYFYVSDSRMNWKSDPFLLCDDFGPDKVQLLIHPIWYASKNRDIKTALIDFMNENGIDDYHFLINNISNIESIFKEK